jgi:hypothetical protein
LHRKPLLAKTKSYSSAGRRVILDAGNETEVREKGLALNGSQKGQMLIPLLTEQTKGINHTGVEFFQVHFASAIGGHPLEKSWSISMIFAMACL